VTGHDASEIVGPNASTDKVGTCADCTSGPDASAIRCRW